MTRLASLLDRLRAADIRLTLEDDDRLNISAPQGALTPELRSELGAAKEEIKAHLRHAAQARLSAAAGVQPIPRAVDMPVSHTQARLWFIKQMHPDSAAYNVPVAFRMQGELDVAALETALADLVARHESLRTRFVAIDGVPRCSVQAQASLNLERVDLSHVPEAQRDAEALAQLVTLARRPFDVNHCPLMHARLVRLAAREHIFVFVLDHIVADGVSTGVLLNEFETLYAARKSGQMPRLAPLPVQYIDFADWQRRWLDGGVLDEQLGYWRRQLRGPVPVLQLPADRPRPAIQSANGARITAQFSRELSDAVRALGRREGTTLFMTLLAAFQGLLYRYTGECDVAVGTAMANRTRPEVERVVGFFANNLVLRGDLSGNPTWRELLGRVRELSAKAYAHQDMPFDLLVESLAPARALDHSPLFQVLFVLHGERVTRLALPELECTSIDIPMGTARFDLAADVFDVPEGLGVCFEYNTDLFNAGTIERMVEHYRTLLEGMVARVDDHIDTAPMLPAAERALLTVGWNRTQADYPKELVLHQLLEAQAAITPEAVALRFEGRALSYGELNAQANQLAQYLRTLGAGPGGLVGLCIERSPQMLVALLAIQKSGAAYVPLDPGFPANRLSYMLSDSGATVLVTAGEAADGVDVPAGVTRVDLLAQAEALAALGRRDLAPLARGHDLAYVIYTSGSTGRPKGVAVTHGALVNFLTSMALAPGLSGLDVIAAVTTISFDIAGLELYLPWLVGAQVELISRDTAADGDALARRLDACSATVLQATPATWRLLLEAGWKGSAGMRALCGGETLPRDLADALLDRVDALWNLYGPTETTIWSTAERVEREGPITIGRPIANTQVYILGVGGEPAPIGVTGEICIGGAGVASGYHRRPELTAERFVPERFAGRAGATLYRTGDLGRFRDDGRIEHLGRLDHQVKIRGFRIELGEIEFVLCQHPRVHEAIVLAISDTPDQQRLVAYVVASEAAPVVSELREHLRKSVPDYMVPGGFVFIDKLPMTYNGKVDRSALPTPDAAETVATDENQAPVTETEKGVAQIFAEVLNIPAVGLRNNFFELGGHSLLATRTVARLCERFEIDVPLTALFQAPTVEGLSRWIDAALEKPGSPAQLELAQVDRLTRWKCLVPTPSNSSRPPLFLITGYMDEDDTLRILSNLIPHLGPNRPLCGLRPRWLDGHSPQYSSVAEMRDEYLRELRAFQPEGPYYLLGDCVGGVVAIEMAQTLLEQGDEVALLVLLDTERPRFHSFLLNEVMRLWDRGHHVASVLREFLRPTEGTRSQAISDVMRRKFRRAGLSKHPITATDHIYQKRVEYQRLLKKHRLKRYPGRIRLIVSEDVYRFVGLLGWNGFADGGVEVSRTPGNHQTFRAQYSREFGQQLRRCIDLARSEREKRVPDAADSPRRDAVLRPKREGVIAE